MIFQEIQSFKDKLMSGLSALQQANNIDLEGGFCKKDAVYQEDKLKLYHYRPLSKKQHSVPLLVVYALVNRPYMADLQKGRSLIEGLLQKGMDVYLLDWGYPDEADSYLSLDDYINGYLDRCVDHICHLHKIEKINILGICQGGTFSLCYASINPKKVRNLVLTVTPVDFQTQHDQLSRMVREVDVDLLVDTVGNIPGDLLNQSFLLLKPFRLMGQKYLDMVDLMDNPEKLLNFLRMEKWIFDSPDQAGKAYGQFIKQFYQQNCFVKGGGKIGEHVVDLSNVSMPILNIYAEQDHLVPPASSKALKKLAGTKDYNEVAFPGGHIGVYVSGKAQGMIPSHVSEWIRER